MRVAPAHSINYGIALLLRTDLTVGTEDTDLGNLNAMELEPCVMEAQPPKARWARLL